MTLTGFALDIIPRRWSGPFVGDNILQVLLVAVLFGIGLAMVGEPGRPVLGTFWKPSPPPPCSRWWAL